IDAGHSKAHPARRLHCSVALLPRELDHAGSSSAVKIRTEFAFARLATHGAHNLSVDNECANVGPPGLFDELLNNNPGMNAMESFDDRLGDFFRFRQHNPQALRALEKLDDY